MSFLRQPRSSLQELEAALASPSWGFSPNASPMVKRLSQDLEAFANSSMAAAAASASASASVQQRLSAKRLSQELEALASSGLAPWSNFAAAAAAASNNGNLNTVAEMPAGGIGGAGTGGGFGMPPPPLPAKSHLNSLVNGAALSSASAPSSLNNQLSWSERTQNALQSAALSAQFGNISDSQSLLSTQLRAQNASLTHGQLQNFGSQAVEFGGGQSGVQGGVHGGPLTSSLSSSSSAAAAAAGIAKPRCLRIGSTPAAMSLPPHQLASAAAWF